MNRRMRPGLLNRMRKLGPRLWALIVLVGAVLTLVTTGIQLFIEYRRDITDITVLLHQIQVSNADSLARSVWSFDERQLRAELTGITSLPDVDRVELVTSYGEHYTHGSSAAAAGAPLRTFELMHESSRGPVHVGRVTVIATLEKVHARIWDRALVILGVQAIKTSLVTLVALFLFQHVVTRHLSTMARYARRMKVAGLHEPLRLNRAPQPPPGDELEEVVTALNEMRTSLSREMSDRQRIAAAHRYLAQVSVQLGDSLDLQTVGDAICRTALERLGDVVACTATADPNGDWWTRAAPEDDGLPEGVILSKHLRDLFELRAGSEHSATLTQPVVVSAELPGVEVPTPAEAEVLSVLGAHAYAIVPLKVRGRPPGVLLLVRTRRDGPSFGDPGEVELLDEYGRRAALAIENALLYRKEQEAIRMREEFLSVASHELKTPLTALQLQIQLAARTVRDEERFPFSREELGHRLGVVKRQGERLRQLIGELLDVSQILGRRNMPSRQEIDLRELIRDVLERMSEQARAAGCPLVLRDPTKVVGQWDPSQIEQVMTNLLGNALKFGAGAPVEIEVSSVTSDWARISVRDHGIGIPKELQTRIFERFARGVSTRNFGGLGLGLYIVREVVLAHGGHISVHSAPGEGARIVVDLPKQPALPSALMLEVGAPDA